MKPWATRCVNTSDGRAARLRALALAERVPAAAVEHRRRGRRTHTRVAVHHAEHHEQDAEQVADQCGVEPHQPVAPDEHDRQRDRHTDEPPDDAAPIEHGATSLTGHGVTVVVLGRGVRRAVTGQPATPLVTDLASAPSHSPTSRRASTATAA